MTDVTRPPQPLALKLAAQDPDPNQPLVLLNKNPYTTVCTCQHSTVMVTPPMFHCPKCHSTYKLRKLTFPNRCASCQFDFAAWMRRNNLTAQQPAFA